MSIMRCKYAKEKKEKRMKNRKNWLVRIVAIVLVALLVFSTIMVYIASAEGEMDIQASASPNSLSGPEEVTLSITLGNDSAYKMENIEVSGNGLSKKIAELSQGSRFEITAPYMVNEYELNDGIPITVRWQENGQPLSDTKTIAIKQKKTNPQVILKRSISKTSGQPGEEIILTYQIQNTGDVDLERIRVTDKGISNAPIWENGTLGVGKETKTIEKKVLLTTANVETHPSVEAKSIDGKTVTDAVSPKNITSIAPKIALSAVAQQPNDEGIPILVTIKNEGNISVESITVQDDANVIIADNLTLAQGESKEYTYVVSQDEPRNVVVSFIGRVKGEKEPISLTTEPIAIETKAEEAELEEVKPEGVETVSADSVDIKIDPAVPSMEQAGELPLRITLDNKGTTTLKNISISEEVRGKLKSIPLLPPGITTIDDVRVSVLADADLTFSIVAYDERGERYEFDVPPVSITVQVPASLPPAPEALEGAGAQDKETGSFMWLMLLLILIVLLLVLLVGLVMVFIKERKAKRKIDRDDEDEAMLEQYEDAELPEKSKQTVKRNLQYDDGLEIMHEPSAPRQERPQPQQARRKTPPAAPPVQSNANTKSQPDRADDSSHKRIVMKNPRTRILNIEMGEAPEGYCEKEAALNDERDQPIQPIQRQPFTQIQPERPVQSRPNRLEEPETDSLHPMDDDELFALTFLGEKPDRRSEEEKLFDDEFQD